MFAKPHGQGRHDGVHQMHIDTLSRRIDQLVADNQKLRAVVDLVNRGSRFAMPPDLVEALEALEPKV